MSRATLASCWRKLLPEQRGTVSVIFALAAIPLVSSVALAVDYSVITDARIALQHAADEAALAGASAYTDSTQASNAQTVATNAFNATRLPGTLSAGTPSVSTNASGTINPNLGSQAAYAVTVTDTATIAAGFIRIFQPSLSITVSATAANPQVQPVITVSKIRASACDGNAAYLYPVTMTNGKPNWNKLPSFTTGSSGNYYDIGNNFGGSLPSSQTLPTVTANQPLGIMLANTKNGNKTGCGSGLSNADSYGNPSGYTVDYYSAYMEEGLPPSQNAASQLSYTLTTTSTTTTTTSGSGGLGGLGGLGGGGGGGGGGNSSTTTTYTANYGSGNVTESDPGNPSCDTGSTSTSSSTNRQTGKTTTTTVLTQTCSSTEPNTSETYAATPSGGSISSTPNCSLYVQTGVTQAYVNDLSSSSSPPNAVASGDQGPCYGAYDSSDGWKYAAPTCSQLSLLSAQTAVFWWNDTGGGRSDPPGYGWGSESDPGSGDDRDYNDAFFALSCTTGNGGSGTGFTAVVLTQ